MVIEELARAKVNLTLQVPGRRADGYHELASLVGFASVGDRVALEPGASSGVAVSGPFAGGISSENLILHTLRKLALAEPRLRLGRVSLEKNLPVAAGIGGGSSDAAAVLRAVRRANPDLAVNVDWAGIAAALGADVPVCLADRLSFMTGIGERLQEAGPLAGPLLPAVLVNPLVVVPDDKTAQVFRALAAPPLPPPGGVDVAAPRIVSADDAVEEIRRTGNALEAAARRVMPVIGDVLGALRAVPGCRVAQMSGAGPTCFGVFDEPVAAALALRAAHPGWWVEAVEIG